MRGVMGRRSQNVVILASTRARVLEFELRRCPVHDAVQSIQSCFGAERNSPDPKVPHSVLIVFNVILVNLLCMPNFSSTNQPEQRNPRYIFSIFCSSLVSC